jgi:hypothetical protein
MQSHFILAGADACKGGKNVIAGSTRNLQQRTSMQAFPCRCRRLRLQQTNVEKNNMQSHFILAGADACKGGKCGERIK